MQLLTNHQNELFNISTLDAFLPFHELLVVIYISGGGGVQNQSAAGNLIQLIKNEKHYIKKISAAYVKVLYINYYLYESNFL